MKQKPMPGLCCSRLMSNGKTEKGSKYFLLKALGFNDYLILLCQIKLTDEFWFLAREYGR